MGPYDTESFAKNIKPHGVSPIRKFFYEIKPLIYLAFSIYVLKVHAPGQTLLKFSTFAVLSFSIYIIHCRLDHRGFYSRIL